jgi:hypothetical protein
MNLKTFFTVFLSLCCFTSAMAGGHLKAADNDDNDNKVTGNTILAFAPLVATESGNIGLGFSYEKMLDKKGMFAMYLPVYATFTSNNNSNYTNNSSSGIIPHNMFYFGPGMKVYTHSKSERVKYALGPSLLFEVGQKPVSHPDTTSTVYPYTTTNYYDLKSTFVMGIMLNNSLNMYPTPHLYVGMEFNFGFSYINMVDGAYQSTTGLMQFAVKMGYRY